MDDRRTARIAVCAGVENAVSGVGEKVVEGVERIKVNFLTF